LLVPFAVCADPGCRAALQGLQLPRLQRLLARLGPESADAGAPASLSTPHERAFAAACGLGTADGLIPLAALQAAQEGLDAGQDGWAWITPAHWQVGRDHIRMEHPRNLQLDDDDSRALLAAMQPWFAEDGIALAWQAPSCWLARGEVFRSLPTASLDRVLGRTVDPWMPAGEAARPIRRLQQEMQMLLYTLPLNEERQRKGLLPVNSFWVSGTGALPAGYQLTPAGSVQVSSRLRDAALLGDWQAWSHAWQEVDALDCAPLAGELERGRNVRLTLCGENGARTWSAAAASSWRRWTRLLRQPDAARLLEGL